jgi:hypothetical protein
MPSYTSSRRRILPDEEIVRLYVEDRLDSDTIGARANCSATYVLDRVREAGHPVRRSGGVRSSLPITDEEIVRRYLGGESGPVLAQAIGCTPASIYAALRRQGVATRPDITVAAVRAAATKRRGRPPAT